MIHYLAHHRTASNLIMFFVFVLGWMSLNKMIRETMPEFSSDEIVVQVAYRGATAEEVEKSVCILIEEAVDGLEGVDEISSKASEGSGQVNIKVIDGYPLDTFYRDVQNEVDKITNFPEDAEEPVVFEKKQQERVISIAISGDLGFRDLKEFGEKVRKDLLTVDEISLVEAQGFSDLEIQIKIAQPVLRSLRLDMNQLRNIIQSQSMDLPMGSIESKDQEILIRLLDQRYSPEEFGDITVLTDSSGAQVKLNEIATVQWALEKEEDQSFLNGKRALILSVSKSDGEDSLNIREAVFRFVEEYQPKLPKGIEMTHFEDRAEIIQDRLSLLLKNGISGFILVFLTLWFFLDLRLAFWVTMGVPFSFMGAIWLMQLFGLTLNMITMLSLLLGIGLIVDDAVVVSENIFVHYENGATPIDACVKGISEVASGVLSSLFTTVSAFLPLIFMEGNIGKVLGVMPIGVILALLMSIFEAFFVLPNHLTHSFKKRGETSTVRKKIDKLIQWVIKKVNRFSHFAMDNRYCTCAIVIMIFISSLGLMAGNRVGFLPFPELDGDVVQCYVLMPSGTPLDKTKQVVSRVEDATRKINDDWSSLQPKSQNLIRNVLSTIGQNSDAGENGSHVAMVTIELLSSAERTKTCDEIIEKWRKLVGEPADIVSLKFLQMAIGPAGKAFEIQVQSKDLDQSSLASLEIQQKLLQYDGVYNVNNDLNPGKWEVNLRTKPEAKAFGFNSGEIFSQMNAAFFGGKAQEFTLGQENVEVRVKLTDQDRYSLSNLEEFYLLDAQGNQVPALNLVEHEIRRGYTVIKRENNRRVVTISGDIDVRKNNAARIIGELKQEFFRSIEEKYSVKIQLEGQAKETAKTASSVQRGFILGMLGIFIILSFNFQSYIKPLVVMATIPLGFTGAIYGHYIMGIDLSMPSVVGIVSLCGIVVNDSIVLVQFMQKNMRSGMTVPIAAAEASGARFRAVFITSATTIAGLLPLTLEKSLQAQVLIPVAVSIAFGLLFATVLVLFFIPCLIGILNDLGLIRSLSDEEH